MAMWGRHCGLHDSGSSWAAPLHNTTGDKQGSVASLWALAGWGKELARSSCFHNYSMAISLAGKHSTSAVPGTYMGRQQGLQHSGT